MRDRSWVLVSAILLCVAHGARAEPVDYGRDVRPILAARCASCHGALRQRAGLRLDAGGLVLRGGDDGAVVVPGRSGESELVRRVAAPDPSERMPPPDEGEPLTDEELAAIRAWIDAGAVVPDDEPIPLDPRDHWAFRPIARPVVPDVPVGHSADDRASAIDAFLAASRAGTPPAAAAPPDVLVRRVVLDLTGLPPTVEERRSFLDDPSPDAYERLVDRLLASPRYGERQARRWMDVWRYSDAAGFGAEVRYSQPHIWRWRDWIVESLDADVGYDAMLSAMLAGDEASPGDESVVRATGFLVRHWYKFDRNAWLDDVVEHTAKAFLGLTMNCARCHDHKYDPITQTEYYRWRAIFEPYDVRTDRVPGVADVAITGLVRVLDAQPDAITRVFHRGDPMRPEGDAVQPGVPAIIGDGTFHVDAVPVPVASRYPGFRDFVLDETLAEEERAVADAREAGATIIGSGPTTARVEAAEARLSATRARIAAERARLGLEASERSFDELARAASRASRAADVAAAYAAVLEAEAEVARRASTVESGDAGAAKTRDDAAEAFEAARARLAAARDGLAGESTDYAGFGTEFPATSTGRRLAFARALTHPGNPLAARVAVNHVWKHHFGRPLVERVDDFGLRSEEPLHSALLDWLAVELIEKRWSLKTLDRLIVTSAAYRLSSRSADAPPESPRRDPDNLALWRREPTRLEAEVVRDSLIAVADALDVSRGGPELDSAHGMDVLRRSLWFRHARQRQMPFLEVFDAANPRECYRRRASIRPEQAYALSNSALAFAMARRVAARIGGDEPDDGLFIDRAFVRVLGRESRAAERSACLEFLVEQRERLAHPEALVPVGDAASAAPPPSETSRRAREDLVLCLFNHDDFVTVR